MACGRAALNAPSACGCLKLVSGRGDQPRYRLGLELEDRLLEDPSVKPMVGVFRLLL